LEGFHATGLEWIDADLVDAARSGSVRAFEELVDLHYAAVLGYLFRQTADEEWARDLTQETFLDAFHAISTLPEDRSFRSWIFVIARNNYRAEARRRGILRIISLDWLLDRSSGALPPAALVTVDQYTDHDRINALLSELSPKLREPLILLSLGYTLRDAAELLGISHATARQRASRGLRQLRRSLGRAERTEDR
jgi:RNA polymerase sigma-70 factor (ECF subfamily)